MKHRDSSFFHSSNGVHSVLPGGSNNCTGVWLQQAAPDSQGSFFFCLFDLFGFSSRPSSVTKSCRITPSCVVLFIQRLWMNVIRYFHFHKFLNDIQANLGGVIQEAAVPSEREHKGRVEPFVFGDFVDESNLNLFRLWKQVVIDWWSWFFKNF